MGSYDFVTADNLEKMVDPLS